MKRSKLVLKIASFSLAMLLIGGLLLISNAFTGNPIAARQAEKAILQYVEEEYPGQELQLGKVQYNFKFKEYYADAKSKISPDTSFRIYYSNGKVQHDEYEFRVAGKWNTLERLEREYEEAAAPRIAQVEGLTDPELNAMFIEPEETLKALSLDMALDKQKPFELRLTIQADMKDGSPSSAAAVLERLHSLLLEQELRFAEYDLEASTEEANVSYSSIKPADIESGQLASRLEAAR